MKHSEKNIFKMKRALMRCEPTTNHLTYVQMDFPKEESNGDKIIAQTLQIS
jgi:hypothetical protein